MLSDLSKVFNPQPGWYRGDFHAHTHFSDGTLTPAELTALARANGLDFFTITDHNTISAYPHFADDYPVIPGVEVTYKRGHYNVLGIDPEAGTGWLKQVSAGYFSAPDPADPYPDLTSLMRATGQHGQLNSINHPRLAPWAWEFPDTGLTGLHCLEIWNDPSWPDNVRDNPRAVALWTRWLNAGYRTTAIGGSDFHRPAPPPGQNKPAERLGTPSTYVYASQLSGAAILDGVRQRRAYVSMGPQVTFQAEAQGQIYPIGADLGQVEGELELTAGVTGCTVPARAYLIKNGSVLAEVAILGGSARLECSDRASAGEPAWYRFDVLDAEGLLLAVTNPIFAGPARPPHQHLYGDFLAEGA